jgi:hypothetical protein
MARPVINHVAEEKRRLWKLEALNDKVLHRTVTPTTKRSLELDSDSELTHHFLI